MRRKLLVVILAVGCLLLGRSVFGAQQLIADGGFGSVTPGQWWTNQGSTQLGVNFVQNSYLSMGNINGSPNTYQLVFQQFTVPTNTLLLEFSYQWRMIDVADPANTVQFVSFLGDSFDDVLTGGVIQNVENTPGDTGWDTVTSVSTNLAGQTLDLNFETFITNSTAGLSTSFYIDNVSALAFTPADIPPNDFFTNSTVLNTSSNIMALGTNVLATTESGEPSKIAGDTGGHSLWWNWTAPSNGVAIINTDGSTFSTLLGVYTGDSISSLKPVAANANGKNSQVKFNASAGTKYQILVEGRNNSIGDVELNLIFSLDTRPPTIAITSPGKNAKLTNSTVIVSGTASDNFGIASVQYQLVNAQGTNGFQAATGTNSWTATITNLIPGLNTIQAYSVSTSGNESAVVSRTVDYIVVSPLSLTVNGTGTVSPNLNNDLLDVGTDYTVTAKPGAGQILSNWVDGDEVLGTAAKLTFTMQSNMVLVANFVANPFTPIVGGYQGLFYDTNGPEHESSGFVNLTLGGSGSYSASVIVAGLSYKLSGQFSAGGMASNNIVRKGLTNVTVQMQLDLTGGGITGVLSDGTWVAELNAEPIATAATAARYTLLIPGGTNAIAQPGGDSYGTVSVSSRGGISFAGALADGTKVSQKANLLENGQWPFYIGLYSGKGSIFGWLTFSNQADSDITGPVDWFKLSGASGKFYSGGFTNVSDATGSLFTNAAPVLNLTDGQVVFSNGNVATFTNEVTLSAANKITNDSTNNALTMSITTSSGLFKCIVVNPSTGKRFAADGVLLQKQNFGSGFFLGTNQTGSVVFGPASP